MRALWLPLLMALPAGALELVPATVEVPPRGEVTLTLKNPGPLAVKVTAGGAGLGLTLEGVEVPPPKPATKWYPGHYQTVKSAAYAGPRVWEREPFKSSLAHPKMRGLLLYINWRELEGPRGTYHFEQIDAALNAVGALGKKLQIKVQDRAFRNEAGGNMPDYVNANGCAFPMLDQNTPNPTDIKGLALKWYKPACVDMFIALYRALAVRYERDNRLWAVTVGDGESALSGAPQQPDYPTPTAHIDQIIRAASEVKAFFPTTLVATGLNNLPDAKQFPRIGDALKALGGSAFTHPDTIPGKNFGGTLEEIRLRGVVPTIPQAQQTAIDPNMPNAERTIFRWAVDHIGVSALTWGDGWRGKGHYVTERVIPFLNKAESDWPAGNLACPVSAQPCQE